VPFLGAATRRLWRVAVALAVISAGGLALVWELSPRPSSLNAVLARRAAADGSSPVTISSVAPVLEHAVLATEDERFYRHRGVDVVGVVRALAYDVSHLSLSQGASTITEQLAKQLYLAGNDHSPWRKLEDAALATRLERAYSKTTILDGYLNTVYFGHDAYGIASAARAYFGVEPAKLSLAQASLLAGLIQSSSAYDPFVNPSGARLRQITVLLSMVRNGFITEAAGIRVSRGLWFLTWRRFRQPGIAALAVAGSLVVAGCVVLARSLRVA
jgi:membrane peptidoglycan carboxypeptidase